MKARVLIVDDDVQLGQLARTVLSDAGYECEAYDRARRALAALEQRETDAVVTDWNMPELNGMALMQEIHRLRPALPVIFLTGRGSVSSVVEAMHAGAADYVAKPFDGDDLIAAVARSLEMAQLRRDNRYLRQQVRSEHAPESFIAESEVSRQVLDLVRRVAHSRSTIMIQGESGTGKELIARMLHYWSDRVAAPLVAVNCKALAEGVLESELFGHEKGAFTGAGAAHAGCFERAHSGTLFLDEIGEIGPSFQAKLLRVLQEGEIQRVGGNRALKVDVRVVAATNRDLDAEVAAGRFREDLFFRLNVIPLRLPPLRERREDILPLANFFLRRFAAENQREVRLSSEAEAALLSHPWPGNIRELENCVERAVVLAQESEIAAADLLLQAPLRAVKPRPDAGLDTQRTLQEHLDTAAVEYIQAVLAETKGARIEAARILGIDRKTLYRLSKRLGIAGLDAQD